MSGYWVLQEGDTVRVVSGPFAGKVGQIVREVLMDPPEYQVQITGEGRGMFKGRELQGIKKEAAWKGWLPPPPGEGPPLPRRFLTPEGRIRFGSQREWGEEEFR